MGISKGSFIGLSHAVRQSSQYLALISDKKSARPCRRCVPSLGGALVEGNGDPLQCSSLGNSVVRGAWEATIQGRHRARGMVSSKRFTPGQKNLNQIWIKCLELCAYNFLEGNGLVYISRQRAILAQ